MGRKFYAETESGGTIFRTERKIGDVRIPNYVYDIWLPILGAQALGVYAVYCRLERQGSVKAMTQAKLARACRMGTGKLSSINEQLEDCGFVKITKPAGKARLMHWTTEITVMDAPQEVSRAIKDKYAPASGYEILTPWLESESPENLDGFSGEPEQVPPETPNEEPNIAPLDVLYPLDVETESPTATRDTPTTFQEWIQLLQKSDANKPALIRAMHLQLYPDRPPPDYGYCGKVARRVGGYEMLMKHLWEQSTRAPVGDVLAYVQGIKKGKNGGGQAEAIREIAAFKQRLAAQTVSGEYQIIRGEVL